MAKRNGFVDAYNLPENELYCKMQKIYKERDTPEKFNEYYNEKCVHCPANKENPSISDLLIGLVDMKKRFEESEDELNAKDAANDIIHEVFDN